MTAEEAAGVIQEIQPQVAIPIHWGNIIGSREDAEKFKQLCSDCVTILEPEN